ncbi:MBL fold metallo-hydrolase [Microbacterium sp. A93]|uniref:MBL fold metallo-hydrolase n=1 Tax=Microbacterium sp. A93 TaxID=3450716 RepID=UPI003F443D17
MNNATIEPFPGPPESVMRWTVGKAKITRIPEKYVEIPFPTFLPDAEPTSRALQWMPDEFISRAGNAIQSFHSFVIEIDDDVILIDTGYGDQKTRPDRVNAHLLRTTYLDSLALGGFSRRNVTKVVNSHGHLDHIGWNTVFDGNDWVPSFPRAQYFMDHSELAYWTTDERSPANNEDAQMRAISDSLLPLRSHEVLSTTHGAQEIANGVEVRPFPGHTPGHLCVRVSSNGQEAWLTGDLLVHPSHVSYPEWGCSIDTDPAQAERSRRELLTLAAERDALVLGAHWPSPTGLRIRATADGRFMGIVPVTD